MQARIRPKVFDDWGRTSFQGFSAPTMRQRHVPGRAPLIHGQTDAIQVLGAGNASPNYPHVSLSGNLHQLAPCAPNFAEHEHNPGKCTFRARTCIHRSTSVALLKARNLLCLLCTTYGQSVPQFPSGEHWPLLAIQGLLFLAARALRLRPLTAPNNKCR